MSTLKVDNIQASNSANSIVFRTGSYDTEQMRLGADGVISVASCPVCCHPPTEPQHLVNKSYVDAGLTGGFQYFTNTTRKISTSTSTGNSYQNTTGRNLWISVGTTSTASTSGTAIYSLQENTGWAVWTSQVIDSDPDYGLINGTFQEGPATTSAQAVIPPGWWYRVFSRSGSTLKYWTERST